MGTGALNASGVASYTTTSLPLGVNSVVAIYGGDSNDSASTSAAVPVTVSAVVASTKTTLQASAGNVTYGGSVTFTATVTPTSGTGTPYRLTPAISVVGEAGAITTGNANSTGLDLTLANYLAGGRYSLRRFQRFTPFAQVLVGATHASGSFAPDRLGLGSSTAFAMAAGGGLNLSLNHRFALVSFRQIISLPCFLTGRQIARTTSASTRELSFALAANDLRGPVWIFLPRCQANSG